jgi:hypothetical protein
VTVGATLVASLLAVLERPATWPLALLGFLIRGGFLLVLAPIIVLPTAIGLANAVAPVLTSALLSGLTATVLLLIVGVGAAGMAWLLGGGLLAGAAEAEGVRLLADDETVDRAGLTAESRGGLAWRILTVRMIAHLPLLLALAWGATRVVAAIYREFTVPVDTVTPLVLRVVRAVPEAIALIVIAWLIGEVLGGLAARRVVMAEASIPRAIGWALRHAVRHPLQTVVLLIVPLLTLVAVLLPSAAAASAAWMAIRVTLADGLPPILTLVAVLLLVVVWAGQLALIGLVTAWRGATWTVAVAGTFGGVTDRREGDWSALAASGSLGDPSGSGSRSGSEEHP